LGDSGKNQEIAEQVENLLIEDKLISKKMTELIRKNSGTTEIRYRIGWALTLLKKLNYTSNPERGLHVLNRTAHPNILNITKDQLKNHIVNFQRERSKEYIQRKKSSLISNGEGLGGGKEQLKEDEPLIDESELELSAQIYNRLIGLTPTRFEHFCARLLRQMGLRDPKVVGQPGDQGVDIRGTLMLNDLIPQEVRIQCKKFKTENSISAPAIQQFRGALSAEEQGIFITTSRYTEPAQTEATRQGFKRIRLIDFEDLYNLMLKYRIGVEETKIYSLKIDDFD
jgi:restriction system protein